MQVRYNDPVLRKTQKMATEHEIQKTVVQWLRLQYPGLPLAAIPNGGKRHIGVAKKLKAEGVSAGFPDIFIPVSRHGFHGLMIELKAEGGRLSKPQAEWLKILADQGYMAVVCMGYQAAIDTIKGYLCQQ